MFHLSGDLPIRDIIIFYAKPGYFEHSAILEYLLVSFIRSY